MENCLQKSSSRQVSIDLHKNLHTKPNVLIELYLVAWFVSIHKHNWIVNLVSCMKYNFKKFLTNESSGRGPCKILSKILIKLYRVYIYVMLTLLTADTKDSPKTNLEYSNTKLLWFKLDS